MLSVIYAECLYAECLYAECLYAECLYAECHYAQCCGAGYTHSYLNLKQLNFNAIKREPKNDMSTIGN